MQQQLKLSYSLYKEYNKLTKEGPVLFPQIVHVESRLKMTKSVCQQCTKDLSMLQGGCPLARYLNGEASEGTRNIEVIQTEKED